MTRATALEIARVGERRIRDRRAATAKQAEEIAAALVERDRLLQENREIKAENLRYRGLIAALWRALDTYKEPPKFHRDPVELDECERTGLGNA